MMTLCRHYTRTLFSGGWSSFGLSVPDKSNPSSSLRTSK